MPNPTDLKPEFLNIARRLQAGCRSNNGVGIISMSIVVDEFGNPLFWSSPRIVLLEPKSQKEAIIKILTEGA